MKDDAEIKRLCHSMMAGARKIYGSRLPNDVMVRLEHEFTTIVSAHDAVAPYLVAYDLVNDLRNSGVAIGPGRGRFISSFAAYVLGITSIDPSKHGLVLEAFVTANLISRPVFYLNIGIGGRREAIECLQREHGMEGVALPLSRNEGRVVHATDILVLDEKAKAAIPRRWNEELKCYISQCYTEDAVNAGGIQINIEESDKVTHIRRCLPTIGDHETRFSDMVASYALDMPRDQELAESFNRRRKGEEPVAYIHPLMEGVLRETYGLLVYEEQIMHLANILAGFSLHEASRLERALGKRIMDAVLQMKEWFVAGCLANEKFRVGKWSDDANARRAIEEIWQTLYAAAPYAVSKAYAVCRAYLDCRCAYLNLKRSLGFNAEAQRREVRRGV